MDWLAFIASMTKSLAWPSVALLLLFLLRTQLGSLADALKGRITKAKLPGGFEFEFSGQLAAARAETEVLAFEGKFSQTQVPEDARLAAEVMDPYLRLAEVSPIAAIIEAFKEVERVLLENRYSLRQIKGHNLPDLVRELQAAELVDSQIVGLFHKVRQLRNMAAHGGASDNISTGEAIEYRSLCQSLVAAFSEAFARIDNLTAAG